MSERLIEQPTDLCLPSGRLRRSAVGWTRRPLHRANLRGFGRKKRWEYWCVQSPELVAAVTVSDLDYAGLYAIYVLDPSGREHSRSAVVPVPRLDMPQNCGPGGVFASGGGLKVSLRSWAGGARIRAAAADLDVDISVERPARHEAMGVVVPWTSDRFQYTVKENTLPATGTVSVAGRTYDFGPETWATLDFGRGKWPYRVTWNWGSGSGMAQGHLLGLQLGGAWTDGTGSTENAVCVDGVLHKLSADLVWEYDSSDWLAPWRITDPLEGRIEATFQPRHVRSDHTNLLAITNDTHQAFGTWHGSAVLDDGRSLAFDGVHGWAEEVRNRW